ncbi:hypothetical protein [Amycolatopsis coloradensis]|uniref:hypothetical protein n=1 Tax=Amycolatopsis coloradensis TaxID=76021 RepID=UPI003CC909D6
MRAAAFIPRLGLRWLPLLISAALLAPGTIVVFPFEMDTIVGLSGDKLVATH